MIINQRVLLPGYCRELWIGHDQATRFFRS